MPDIFVSAPEEKQTPKESSKVSIPEKLEKPAKVPLPLDSVQTAENFLSAYLHNPENVEFETRGPQEKVILFLRQHPFVNFKWVVVATLMVFAPISLRIFPMLSFMPGNFRFITVLGWYLLTAAFVLENFINWFYNIYVVTNERIIDINFYNLVYKEVADANIEKIQDITYRMGGVLKSVFGYGDVFIQTAAEISDFEFPSVPNPEHVARILQELVMSKKEVK